MVIIKKVFKVTDSISKLIGVEPLAPEVSDIVSDVEEIKDQLDGGLDSTNSTEYRNTYVFNDNGYLDSTYDLIVDFELISEMTKLVEVKVSFKVRNFNIGVKDI